MGWARGLVIVTCLGLLTTCVDPFEVDDTGSNGLLVVEGIINDIPGDSRVLLSRSTTIDGNNFEPVVGATVTILRGQEGALTLTMTDSGKYVVPPFFRGTVGQKYLLQVITAAEESYTSDTVIMRSTPDIEQITGRYEGGGTDLPQGAGIYFFVDTQDPTGNTRFYRWEWEETYEIRALFESKFIWVSGNTVIDRLNPNDRCWSEDVSNNIILRSTEGLSEDVVDQQFIRYLPPGTDAVSVRYSLLVRQYSLSTAGFQFWEQLRIMNEDQGSLFDVQPGAVIGNLRSDNNPNELVLGYFDATEVKEERRFFTPREFADQGFDLPTSTLICEFDTIPILEIGDFYADFEGSANPPQIHDLASTDWVILPNACVDCSDRGTIFEPEFWE